MVLEPCLFFNIPPEGLPEGTAEDLARRDFGEFLALGLLFLFVGDPLLTPKNIFLGLGPLLLPPRLFEFKEWVSEEWEEKDFKYFIAL